MTKFANSSKLQEILLDRIKRSPQRKITFAEYMALALYDRQYGYYSSGIVKIGVEGDFFTAASLGKDFGELLAVQFQQMWHNLDCPNPFYIVEMGAGNGQLAKDILSFLHNGDRALVGALKYIIVEQSPALIATQQQLLQSLNLNLTWKTWSDIASDSIVGCFFSNELVDAFPVHLIEKDRDRLCEVYLTLDDGELSETLDVISTDNIVKYFEAIGIDLLEKQYPQGYRTEVNLQAGEWLKTVATKLDRGYVLTIDYGYSADKYYRPARDRGTLQCYYQHRRHANPYANLGYQDLTAHVDFTALERQGELYNLTTLGFTQQGLFLMALGLGDRLNELSSGKYNITEIFQRRDALHQLIDPTGLGGFGVLIQGKNLSSTRSLQGLTTPAML